MREGMIAPQVPTSNFSHGIHRIACSYFSFFRAKFFYSCSLSFPGRFLPCPSRPGWWTHDVAFDGQTPDAAAEVGLEYEGFARGRRPGRGRKGAGAAGD